MSSHVLTFDRFYPRAKALRSVFDQRFKNPLSTHAQRFAWDYWHVPGEYTVLRTPAYHYFPKATYEAFHRYLVQFGRMQLGCHDISPPWLSCYIEGCRQEPHQDVPHGPLAFVFSLTDWSERKFTGGETFILKPRTRVEPLYNRLTVFNPALTHGVREVRGTHDPREGRLVVHGWFVNPRPFWVGPLTARQVQDSLDEGLSRVLSEDYALGEGLLTLRLRVDKAGRVGGVKPLVSTLLGGSKRDQLAFMRSLRQLRFPQQRASSQLTLPLMLR